MLNVTTKLKVFFINTVTNVMYGKPFNSRNIKNLSIDMQMARLGFSSPPKQNLFKKLNITALYKCIPDYIICLEKLVRDLRNLILNL